MPAWIATCHASGGSFRFLPMSMMLATVPRCSSVSFDASCAPLPGGPDVIGPRLALQVSDAFMARAWSAAWSCDTTWVTALTPATATVTTTTSPPTTMALFTSAHLLVESHPPAVGCVDHRDEQVVVVGRQ